MLIISQWIIRSKPTIGLGSVTVIRSVFIFSAANTILQVYLMVLFEKVKSLLI